MLKHKKIIILSAEFPPLTGGAGRFINDFSRELSLYGNEVSVVTRGVKGTSHDKNLHVHFVHNIPKLFLFNIWFKFKNLGHQNYDYIILNDIGAAYIGAFLFSKSTLSKTICILHGQEPESEIDSPGSLLKKVLGMKNKYLKLLMNCSIILAVSNDLKNKIVNSFKLYSDISHKINVVHNNIDPEIFKPLQTKAIKQRNNPFIMLSVSRIVKDKGYDLKLHIFEKLYSQKIIFKWIIVGDGDYKKELEETILKSPIKDCVTFTGKKNKEELVEHYSSADLFILLSQFRESFGLVYLEAIACGCPAIGLDHGGVKEIIQDGINGYLIKNTSEDEIIEESCEKIKKIIDQPFQKDKLVSSVNKFHVNNNVKEFMKIIEKEDNNRGNE